MAAGVAVRIVAGLSLSRRRRVAVEEASSRQLLPSDPPEKDDFCQLPGVVTARLTAPSSACS